MAMSSFSVVLSSLWLKTFRYQQVVNNDKKETPDEINDHNEEP